MRTLDVFPSFCFDLFSAPLGSTGDLGGRGGTWKWEQYKCEKTAILTLKILYRTSIMNVPLWVIHGYIDSQSVVGAYIFCLDHKRKLASNIWTYPPSKN